MQLRYLASHGSFVVCSRMTRRLFLGNRKRSGFFSKVIFHLFSKWLKKIINITQDNRSHSTFVSKTKKYETENAYLKRAIRHAVNCLIFSIVTGLRLIKCPYKCKGNVIPLPAVEVLRVARGWGSHIFRHSAHRWRQGCQPYSPADFYPQEDSLYSFMLEAVDPWVILKLEGLDKLKNSTSSGTRTGDLLACSIVSQPTTLPHAPKCPYTFKIEQ
jgi:hypothetical protein